MMRNQTLIKRIITKIRTLSLQYRFKRYRSGLKPLTKDTEISFVIFSKDRSLQLHALLSSMTYHLKGKFEVFVLYAASDVEYLMGFDKLITDFKPAGNIHFCKQEKGFKAELTAIAARIKSSRMFFLVDDIIFTAPVDLAALQHIDVRREIYSLRLGAQLNYSYVVDKPQKLPALIKDPRGYLSWSWRDAELDWAYPLSVDGHLFAVDEVRFWIEQLDYKSPNSFEANMQLLSGTYLNGTGLCKERSSIFNNPCNKVQTEADNIFGQHHQLELLQLWNDGYVVNFKALEGYWNLSVHEEVQFNLLKRGGDE